MLFVNLNSLAILFKHRDVKIDNPVFSLHYRVTFGILLLFSIVIGMTEYLGDPIDCIHSYGDMKEKAVDFFDLWCFTHGTYTVQGKHCGPYQGVDQFVKGDKIKHHTYYQWIGLVLFIQAILFYVPHYLWKSLEGGHLVMLVGGLCRPSVKDDDEVTKSRTKMITNYLTNNLGNYNFYHIFFVICECLNLINSIAQLFVLDVLFGYDYLTFGKDILHYVTSSKTVEAFEPTPSNSLKGMNKVNDCSSTSGTVFNNPLELIFPTMAKCELKVYGPSGQVVPHDGLCVLPLNAFTQKTYAFIWFLLIIVSAITGLAIIFRFYTFGSRWIRYRLLKAKLRFSTENDVRILVDKTSVGDWFILYQLSMSMNPIIFKDIIHNLAENIDQRKSN